MERSPRMFGQLPLLREGNLRGELCAFLVWEKTRTFSERMGGAV